MSLNIDGLMISKPSILRETIATTVTDRAEEVLELKRRHESLKSRLARGRLSTIPAIQQRSNKIDDHFSDVMDIVQSFSQALEKKYAEIEEAHTESIKELVKQAHWWEEINVFDASTIMGSRILR